MNLRRFFLVLVVTLGLTACGAPTKVAVKPELTRSVKTVAIIRPAAPVTYRMFNVGSPMAAFGAIGGAVIGANAEEGQKYLTGVLEKKQFRFEEQLIADLEKQLQMSGYKTVIVDAARAEADELLPSYDAIDAKGADAILDLVVVNTGWVTEHFMFSPFWRPEARVHAALHVVKANESAYTETLMYGYHNPFLSGTELDAPEKYRFAKSEDLASAGEDVLVEGLRDTSRNVAIHIATQLHSPAMAAN